MQTIGERLEEARKRKGISIREAAEHTKIRGDYLQKFEANAFDLALPPLYIRGFVRAYARYLELDADRFLQDYDATLASAGKAVRRETREVYGRVDFGEAGDAKPAAGAAQMDQAVMMKFGLFGGGALVLIIIVVLLFNLFSSRASDKPAAAKQTVQVPAATVQADAAQTLTLVASEATRVKVVQELDNKVLFNGALARGETRSMAKQGKLLITVEAGKNLRMEVNGRNYPVPLEGYGRFALD